MSDLDQLPFTYPSDATANGAKGKPRCRRHDWYANACRRCGVMENPVTVRRGRNNASRGKRIQRKRIEGLGGTNLAGNNPNLDGIGELFRYESKSGGSFSERYWRWLRGIPKGATQVGVLIVTDTPGPGHRARSIVVVDYDDWRDLHGELGPDAA